jgi:DNA-binding beta-propeller fold protein YncE
MMPRMVGCLGCVVASLMLVLAVAPAVDADSDIPNYVNDPSWPRPFPSHRVMGPVGGLAVDRHDRIWVLQRALDYSVDEQGVKHNLAPADRMPAVVAFDEQGNIVKSWGGQGYVPDWPKSEHGLWVDAGGNVWIGGSAPGDRQLLKFTADGQQLLEIGHPTNAPRNNADTTMLGEPTGIEVDDTTHEVYVSDGYLNSRIVVYDSNTGKFKRGWGAYGIPLSEVANPPEPTGAAASTLGKYVREGPDYVPGEAPEKQFRTPVHCVHLSADGYVYVCDRRNDRIQVFTRQGKFLKEFFVHRQTRDNGSVWTLNFSHDPTQKYLLVGDGINQRIWVLRRRDGREVSSFGAGYIYYVHQAALDSKGNYYIGDVGGAGPRPVQGSGKSVQKFVLQGKTP